MKRIIAIILNVSLCLSLLACNKPSVPSGTEETEPGYVEVQKPDSLPDSGWVTRTDASFEAYAFTKSGFFYLFNQCLYYLDTDSGYSAALCSKPGCLHGEEDLTSKRNSCDAFVSGLVTMMFCHNDSLYYVIYEETGYELYARSTDGTNLRKTATLGSQQLSQDTTMEIGTCAYANGYLYYVVFKDKTITLGDNTFTHETEACILVRFNLANGKEEVLMRSADEKISILGVNEDMAIVWMSHMPTTEETKRPDYGEYMKQFPAYLRLWHKESGGVSTLCESDRSTMSSLLGFADGKLHMFGGSGTKAYAYDFASMTFGDSDLPEGVNRIWSEKYAGVKWKGYYDLETDTYYTNEYDTMQLPAEIEKFGASPIAFGEQGFIVTEYYSKEHDVIFSNTVYFSYEKMTDGLQLSDRVIFMRHDDNGYQLLQPES